MSVLKIEFKRIRSNTWELKARAAAKSNATFAEDIPSFIRGFNCELKGMKLDSYGHISDSYKAVELDNYTAHVIWKGHTKADGKDITIAVITKS